MIVGNRKTGIGVVLYSKLDWRLNGKWYKETTAVIDHYETLRELLIAIEIAIGYNALL